MRIITMPASLLLLWTAGVGVAASPEAPPVPVLQMPAADERQSMDLRELITMAGSQFGKQFTVDPTVRGSVNLDSFSTTSLTYHAFLELLGVHGLVAVPSSSIVTIVPEASATSVYAPIFSADDIRGDDAEVVTVVIPTQGDAQQIVPVLRQLTPRWASMRVMPDRKSLLVMDRVANIKRLVAVVRTQSPPGSEITGLANGKE